MAGVHLPLFIDRVIVSFHGGSPFRFGDPDSYQRIRENRPSTFNYARETLGGCAILPTTTQLST